MAAGTPQEQEWPALYPEKASTPGTLEKFADQHPISQSSNLNQIRQKFDQGPKLGSNNPFTARAKDHNLVNRLNTPCPTGKRMKEATGGKRNQARTARGNTNKQPPNVAATGHAPQMHLTVSSRILASSLTRPYTVLSSIYLPRRFFLLHSCPKGSPVLTFYSRTFHQVLLPIT
jgi:hypothetical protein